MRSCCLLSASVLFWQNVDLPILSKGLCARGDPVENETTHQHFPSEQPSCPAGRRWAGLLWGRLANENAVATRSLEQGGPQRPVGRHGIYRDEIGVGECRVKVE